MRSKYKIFSTRFALCTSAESLPAVGDSSMDCLGACQILCVLRSFTTSLTAPDDTATLLISANTGWPVFRFKSRKD